MELELELDGAPHSSGRLLAELLARKHVEQRKSAPSPGGSADSGEEEPAVGVRKQQPAMCVGVTSCREHSRYFQLSCSCGWVLLSPLSPDDW